MNKRLLLILPLLLLSFSGFAQLQKGNKILGGGINYSASTTNSDDFDVTGGQTNKSNGFVIAPIFGFFVSDRTVVGLTLDFNTYTSENTLNGSVNKNESDRFSIGPFVRRYFPVKEWVAFYGQADLGLGFGNVKSTYSASPNQNYERSINTVNFRASLGMAFFPTNWMSVDLAMYPLSFSHTVNKNEVGSSFADQNTNSFNFNLNSQSFYVGAHFFLNKK